jgi:hypothetical protein
VIDLKTALDNLDGRGGGKGPLHFLTSSLPSQLKSFIGNIKDLGERGTEAGQELANSLGDGLLGGGRNLVAVDDAIQKLHDSFGDTSGATSELDRETRKLSGSMGSLDGDLAETERETRKLQGAMGDAATSVNYLQTQYDNLMGILNAKQDWEAAKKSVDEWKFKVAEGKTDIGLLGEELTQVQVNLATYTKALEGVPDFVKSEILTEIQAGDVEHAEAVLAIWHATGTSSTSLMRRSRRRVVRCERSGRRARRHTRNREASGRRPRAAWVAGGGAPPVLYYDAGWHRSRADRAPSSSRRARW